LAHSVAEDEAPVQSLSGVIDGALQKIAQGGETHRLTKHALRLEREIRRLVAAGAAGSLSSLLDKAAQRSTAQGDALFGDSFARLRAVLKLDGELVDSDRAMPARLLTHVWKQVQRRKARAIRADIDRLILKLSDILKSDFVFSHEGRSAASLKAAVGAGHEQAFDFEAMSRLLDKAAPKDTLSDSRRQRIRRLVATLQAQKFLPPSDQTVAGAGFHAFAFDSAAGALDAYRERLPSMIELAKAMAMAELETAGAYKEVRHDAFFADFAANGLDPQDAALFPDYLVCVNAGAVSAGDAARLMDVLTAGLPMKILVQIDDILEPLAVGSGRPALGARSRQIASSAMSQGEIYVLQSTSSNLFRFRDRIQAGLDYRGPALFSVFSGATAHAGGLPPYLVAAAALEARAFPAFVYDPSRGSDWASRFYLQANPQAELDWPVQNLGFEDEAHQRGAEKLAFTLVDFLASDRRYAASFARVPRAKWNGHMVPVAESLREGAAGAPETVPCLLMVGGDNVLHKVIVDRRLMREARRCLDMWRSLQELGGIHNSHAERLLAQERKAWEEQLPRAAAAGPAPVMEAAQPAAAVPAVEAAAAAQAESERESGEAYIETARCTSCNECTQINDKMFAYNKDKQAFIADAAAGTFRQLVEAAESCQVSIIHPGKPRNADEPGLDELIKRAEAFP
jgi:ferredoxin